MSEPAPLFYLPVDNEEATEKRPYRAAAGSAGVDLPLCENVTLPPGKIEIVRSGYRFKIPFGYAGKLEMRSFVAASRMPIMLLAGVIGELAPPKSCDRPLSVKPFRPRLHRRGAGLLLQRGRPGARLR